MVSPGLVKLLKNTAGLTASVFAGMAATAAGVPIALLSLGYAAALLAGQAWIEAHDEKALDGVRDDLQTLLDKHENLSSLVEALAQGRETHQHIKPEQAQEVHTLLTAGIEELTAITADNTALIKYSTEWFAKTQEEYGERLTDALESLGAHLSEQLARLQAGQVATHRKLDDLAGKLDTRTADLRQSLHQLPAPVGDFTGRTEEVNDLLDHARRGGVAICGLQGMGGIGKTELAYKLAERLQQQYPDAQILYDLRGTDPQPRSPDDAMRHVLLSFDRLATLPEDFDALRAAYLSRLNGLKALLLMDNASNGAQVEPLIPPPGCALLVTSRTHFTVPGLFVREIRTLPPDQARDLLVTIAPRLNDANGAADRIAGLCAYLPLALRLAGSALAQHPDLDENDYIRRLTDEHKRLATLDKYADDPSRGVEASIRLSESLLSEARRRQWHVLSVFPADFEHRSAMAVWEADEEHARDALRELRLYSLLDWNGETKRYHLHDLVRLFAEQRLSRDPARSRVARRRHAEHYLGVLAAADDLYRKHGESTLAGLALFDRERPNIEAGFRWARENSGADDRLARLCCSYPDAGANCLDLRQHPTEQLLWLQAALAAAERLADRPAAARHAGNLGVIHQTRGDLDEAERMLRKALEVAEKLGGLEGMATDYGNLGIIQLTRGDLDEAERMLRKALEIEEKLGRLEGMANAYGNLGLIHKTRGDLDEAERMLRKALEIDEKLGRLVGMANAYGNLGLIHRTRGELDEAERMHRKALEMNEKLGRLVGMASAYAALALVHQARGDLDDSERMHHNALEIEEKLGRLEGMARQYCNLGTIHQTRGDLGEAERMLRKALEIHEQLGHREGMASDYANLASVQAHRGDIAGARELGTKARNLYARIGMPQMVTKLQGWLDGLPPSEGGEAKKKRGQVDLTRQEKGSQEKRSG